VFEKVISPKIYGNKLPRFSPLFNKRGLCQMRGKSVKQFMAGAQNRASAQNLTLIPLGLALFPLGKGGKSWLARRARLATLGGCLGETNSE
jgi:hypothetical protein